MDHRLDVGINVLCVLRKEEDVCFVGLYFLTLIQSHLCVSATLRELCTFPKEPPCKVPQNQAYNPATTIRPEALMPEEKLR